MGERDLARHSQEARARMSEIAGELARRASPDYIKARASEATMDKARELRGRAMESPTALAVVGGILGALLGARLARSRSREYGYREAGLYGRRFDREYGRFEGYEGYDRQLPYDREMSDMRDMRGMRGTGERMDRSSYGGRDREISVKDRAEELGERVSGKVESMKDKAVDKVDDIKDQARAKAENVKERASEALSTARERAEELRERIPSSDDVKEKANRAWGDQPLLFSLLALCVGALAGLFLPVGARERRLLEPAKQKAREGMHRLGDLADEKLSARPDETRGAMAAGVPAGVPSVGYRDVGINGRP